MADMGQLVVQLELQQAQFAKGMNDAARRLEVISSAAKKSQQGLNGMATGFEAMKRAAGAAAAALGAFRGGEAIIRAADNIKTLQASFTALTGDAARGADMLQRVVDVAMRTGAPMDETGAAMQRLTIAMKEMGASNEQVADLAENFLKLGKIGGSSAEDAGRALTQLAQGLAAGALQGEELKAILEGMPLVAQAIAKELGVTIGQLKKMGADGSISAKQVATALLKMTKDVDKAFAGMPVTLEQSLNRLQTSWTQFLASFDKASNLGKNVETVLGLVADTIKRWTDELDKADGAMSGIGVIAKGLDLAFRGVAGAAALMNAQLEIAMRSLMALVALAADVTTGFSNAGKIMEDYGRSVALIVGQTAEFEKKLVGLGKAQEQAARGASNLKLGGGAAAGGGAADKLKKEAEALQKRADALAASVNPQFAYNEALAEMNMLLEKGFLSEVNYALAKAKAIETLNAEADAVRAMIDPYFTYERELAKVNALYMAGKIEVEELIKAMEMMKEKADDAAGVKKMKSMAEMAKEVGETMASAAGDFFGDIISGAATAEEAFKKMAQTILSQIAKLVAEAAAAWIVKSLLSGPAGAAAAPAGNAVGSASMARVAANTNAATFGPSTRAGSGATTMGGTTIGGNKRPELKVVVNNNAGAEVSTRQDESGNLEITIERVRQALSRDVRRGGNMFADTLERSYSMQRRGV